jgi:uncharacterized membrane protein
VVADEDTEDVPCLLPLLATGLLGRESRGSAVETAAESGAKAWRRRMAAGRGSGGNIGGIGLGGILVIVGVIVMLVWSFLLGLIITLVGLVAFGGFAKGKWY